MFVQENIQLSTDQSFFSLVEHSVIGAVGWLRLGIEAIGAIVICVGVILAIYQFISHFRDKPPGNFNRVRLTLGKYLALALEFQVGADILSTAIAPSWEQIGKLAAIASIRTLLNYFLSKELTAEQKHEKQAALTEEPS